MHLFDLELAHRREAERRLKLLGTCVTQACDTAQLRDRSRETCVPLRDLTTWQYAYQQKGIDGLLPRDWQPLPELSQQLVVKRLTSLGPLADPKRIVITTEDIRELADRNNWSYSTAERWVQRYRIGGLWALDRKLDPRKQQGKRKKQPHPALATLDEKAIEEILRRKQIIEPLLAKVHISNAEIEQHAEEHHISPRTLRYYLADYRNHRLSGLAPKPARSDKGQYHIITERMVHIIRAIRLSTPDISVRRVLEEACKKAHLLSEPKPTEWQVRSICQAIPDEVTMIADGRFDKYRDKRRMTYRQFFDGSVIVYQIDFTPVDVLVKDMRKRGYRTKSGQIRPRLTLCMDASSRLVLAAIFTYDTPDRFTIASAIRDALSATEEKPYGGTPDEIWVDHGKQMISKHVQLITQELHIELHDCRPHDREDNGNPQEKGIVERFFETLNTRLWSTLEGYVNSNTEKRNPHAQAKYTLAELADKFWEFIDKYHHEVHSETGMTPLDYWAEHCYTEAPDPTLLDIILQVRDHPTLIKEGIKHDGRVYWHDDLGEFIPVGAKVLIRAQPGYGPPDEIEVYYNYQWICTAFDRDSAEGRAVTGQRVLAAQRKQKKYIRGTINQERAVLKEAEREIEKQQGKTSPATQPSSPPRTRPTSQPVQARTSRGAEQATGDVWDDLVGLLD
ncbi:MAG: helix-turn-helix domain-containing protein [Ktedonobacteraceae bacterium]